jgi:DNA-binding protein Fis
MATATDGDTERRLGALALVIAEAVPGLVDRLAVERPGRIYREALAMVERPLLLHALRLTGGSQLQAARLLGINRNTFRKRCRELGLDIPRRTGRPAAVRS